MGAVAVAAAPLPLARAIIGVVPFYDYRCEGGHTFEVSQAMADDALEECVECGAPAVRVLHSPAAAVAGASTYGSGYSAKPKAAEKSEPHPEQQGESDGESWIDSAERRQGPPKTFRRGLRRN